MALSLRTGIYGQYYGNDYNSSNSLNTEQMQINALYIHSALASKGWTINSIAALLGNLQAESSINPGRWQSDRIGGDVEGHGYGLVQWTPYTKYTDWIVNNGYADPSEMDANIYRILWEVENNEQWIATSSYPMSFSDFSTSELTVSELAKAFLLCYERPADQSTEVQSYRSELANVWYEFLGGTPITPPGTNKKKSKYKFHLLSRRRRIYG